MENADMADLVRRFRVPLELNVKPGEEVLILADDTTEEVLPKAAAAAVREIGAAATVVQMRTMPAPNSESPRPVAAAIKNSDFMVNLGYHPMLHTDTMRSALASGTRYLAMPQLTVENLTHGAATMDLRELVVRTEKVAALLSAADSARVTSAEGTDVSIDLRGRRALVLAGVCLPGQPAACFPDGEAPIAPVEGRMEGTIVFDTAMNPFGKLSAPVVAKVRAGRIASLEGGPEAGRLWELLAGKNDENSFAIGEFSIGTNPKARVTGNMSEDKRKEGTVHFGIGDNITLNGANHARIHLDGLILRPTVYLDGKMVVENGNLRI